MLRALNFSRLLCVPDDCGSVRVCRLGGPVCRLLGAALLLPAPGGGSAFCLHPLRRYGISWNQINPSQALTSDSVCPAVVLEADNHLEESHVRHRRSAPQLKALPLSEENADSRANLSELLARLISTRKGVIMCVCPGRREAGTKKKLLA